MLAPFCTDFSFALSFTSSHIPHSHIAHEVISKLYHLDTPLRHIFDPHSIRNAKILLNS